MKKNTSTSETTISHIFSGIDKNVATQLFRTIFKAPVKRARHIVDILTP